MPSNTYENAAEKNKPATIRVLFIAESPLLASGRYFYLEESKHGDWLWVALMKALYGPEWKGTKEERRRKPYWLKRFQSSGFFLIDAVKEPTSSSSRKRMAQITSAAPDLIREVMSIGPKQIVLIKATVHHALFQTFEDQGLPVCNKGVLPFPSSGRAARFAEGFRNLMPHLQMAMAQGYRSNPHFRPIEIRGEPLSTTVLRDRSRNCRS